MRFWVLGVFIIFIFVAFIPQKRARSVDSDPVTVKPESEDQVDPGDYDFHLGLKLGSLLPAGTWYKEIGLSVLTSLLADIKLGRYFSLGGFFTYFYSERYFTHY